MYVVKIGVSEEKTPVLQRFLRNFQGKTEILVNLRLTDPNSCQAALRLSVTQLREGRIFPQRGDRT